MGVRITAILPSCYARVPPMVRFQRQPPGTAVTRTSTVLGMILAITAAPAIVAGMDVRAGAFAACCA